MSATGLWLTAGKEPIGELLAVIGQQLGDLDRVSLVQGLQEGPGTGGCLVGFDLYKHPARGSIDGHEEVATLSFILHLRQVLHIHVQIIGHIALEGLVRLGRLAGLEGMEIAHAVAAQAPV